MLRLLSFLLLLGAAFPSWATDYFNTLDSSAGAIPRGTSLPASCSVGQVFFKTDAAAGANLYGCTTTNTWTAQAGGGTPGGSNTQVQFNSSNALAGSPCLTWVSPALSLGVLGTCSGQLKLGGTTSGVITLQPQGAAGTYNFNFPTTAGTSGQVFTSGGGGSTASTWSDLTALSGSLTDGGVVYTDGTSVKSGAAATLNAILLGGGAAGSGPKTASGITTDGVSAVTFGASGTLGSVTMGNATSGTLKIQPVTGALGSTTLLMPIAVGTGRAAQVIAAGTSAMGTSAITSGTCATVVTTGATGTATTDVVRAGFNGDPTGVTGYAPSANGMLTIIAYPSADNVNFKVCNNTGGSITPGALTLNWSVTR